MERECGFLVCKNGKPFRMPTVCGTSHSMSLPINCPAGTKPLAIQHNHPSNDPRLSETDKATARRHNVKVCTKTIYGTRCYKVKKRLAY